MPIQGSVEFHFNLMMVNITLDKKPSNVIQKIFILGLENGIKTYFLLSFLGDGQHTECGYA